MAPSQLSSSSSSLLLSHMHLLSIRDDEKPTSSFLKSGVPGIICGVIVLIAAVVCCYFLWRNKRRDAREAKADRKWNDDSEF